MSQDEFLDDLMKSKISVSIYLVNGIRLHGTVTAHDKFGLYLGSVQTQFVYKHSISTIVPTKSSESREPPQNEPSVEVVDSVAPSGTLRRSRKLSFDRGI